MLLPCELGTRTYSPLPCLLSLLIVKDKAPLVPWLAWLAGRPLPGRKGATLSLFPFFSRAPLNPAALPHH